MRVGFATSLFRGATVLTSHAPSNMTYASLLTLQFYGYEYLNLDSINQRDRTHVVCRRNKLSLLFCHFELAELVFELTRS